MISYSLERNTRLIVIRAFVFIVLLFAVIFSRPNFSAPIYNYLDKQLEVGAFLGYIASVSSTFGMDIGTIAILLFSVLFYMFNRWIWHWPILRRWLHIPNLNGRWIGTLNRPDVAVNDTEKQLPVMVTIKQNFWQMSLILENPVSGSRSGQTTSHSEVLGFSGNMDSKYLLRDGYKLPAKDQKIFFGTTEWTIHEDDRGPYMTGNYVSSVPSMGRINVRHVPKNQVVLKGKIQKLKDCATGEDYLAICVPTRHVKKFRKQLGREIPSHTAFKCSKNRINKDGPEYHLVVVEPTELASMSNEAIASVMCADEDVNYILQQNGEVKDGDATAYFIITHSPHITYRRAIAGLPPKDLHVTIGYDTEDVPAKPKGFETRIKVTKPWFYRRIYQ